MAKPKTIQGISILLLLEDPATPGVFSQMCGITAKTITFQKNTTESFVIDCDTPTAVPWRELFETGKFVSIAGEGVMDTVVKDRMFTLWGSSVPINGRLEFAVASINGGGYFGGAWRIPQFVLNGQDAFNNANASVQVESHGEITWTPAA